MKNSRKKANPALIIARFPALGRRILPI